MKACLRKNILALVLIAGLLLFAGCGAGQRQTDLQISQTGPLPAEKTLQTEAPEYKEGEAIPTVKELSGKEVEHIRLFDDSHSSETPSKTYASDEDVGNILVFLQGFRLVKLMDTPKTAAPGAWSYYKIFCFDGREITVSFLMDMVSFGEGYYTFDRQPGVTDAGSDNGKNISLRLEQTEYPAGTSEIKYTIFNGTGKTIAVSFAPLLEQSTPTGWKSVRCKTGYCGTPDPVVGLAQTGALPLTNFPSAIQGTFRLSFHAFDPSGNEKIISALFVLKDKA